MHACTVTIRRLSFRHERAVKPRSLECYELVPREDRRTSVKECIDEFQKSIARYNRSIGEDSERVFLKIALRKVQWAIIAADVLLKVLTEF